MGPAPLFAAAADPIIALLRERCCVSVLGASPGTGFFVSPQLVLTCAHVVGQDADRSFIELRQGEKRFPAKLLELHGHDNDDLALLEVSLDHAGVPIPLGNEVWLYDRLVLSGYPSYAEGQAFDTLSATYDSFTDLAEQRIGAPRHFLHKFKSAHVVPGFSGGPLLNLETMRAVGIVSHTRSKSGAIGGWAIPAEIACDILAINKKAGRSLPASEPIEWRDAVQARARLVAERQQQTQRILSGLPSLLPHATAIANFIASYIGTTQNSEPFGGRDAEMQALDEWAADDGTNPYLIVTAPLGRGKSALLVHWATRLLDDETYRVVFVPVSVRYDLNTPTAIFSALAARLCETLKVRNPLPLDASADLWRELVCQLLNSDVPKGSRVVVVLDGIDECAGWEFGPGTFPARPAARVKVVLSARDRADRSGTQWLETLNWLDPDVARLIPLRFLDHGGVEKVVRTVLPQSVLAANLALIDQLWRLSAGDPLVLSLYIKALRDDSSQEESLLRVDDLAKITPGLDGFFTRWWNDQRRLWGIQMAAVGNIVYALFNVLALAFGPLERGDLLNLLRRVLPDVTGDDLDQALSALARFVVRDELRTAYVLGHSRFGAHRLSRLREDGDYDRYERAFLEWGRLFLRPPASGQTASKPSRYIVRYFLAHLDRAQAQPADYIELLDTDWRASWEQHSDEFGSFAIVLDEVRQRLSRFDRESIQRGDRASLLGQQLRCALELAELRDATHSVAPEMLGSLVKLRLSSISASFDHIGRLEHGWERAASLAKIIPFITKEHLSRVEQIIEDLKGEHQDYIADIFDALCARICQLVSIQAARELVSVAPAGYSRASVHMRLASLTHGKEQNEELVAAFEEFEACDGLQKFRMVERYAKEFASGGDSGAAHFGGRIPAPVQAYIEENITGTVAPESFGLPIQCQYIEYILPFVSDTQRAEYIGAYFRGVLNGFSEGFWYVGEFFRDNGQLVPTSLLAEAVAVADVAFKARDGFDFTAAILSLWPRLTDKQRHQWRPHLLEAIGKVDEWPSINDRRDAFALLGQRGFTATALEIIEAAPDDDWSTVDLIVAVAPHLSEEESERALALIQDIRLETQDRARRAILARLASFSRERALAARRHAGSIDVGLEARIALNIVNALAAPGPKTTQTLVDGLSKIEDTIFRFSALQLCHSLFEALGGHSVARLTASLIDSDRDAGRVSMAAFALLAETIDATDLVSPVVLSLVSHLLEAVPSESKLEMMTPYFARAVRIGVGGTLVTLAEDLGSAGFEIPIVATIYGVAAASNDPALIAWASDKAQMLNDEWLRLSAYASLMHLVGDGDLLDAWQPVVHHLDELTILASGNRMAEFLRKLPEAKRDEYFQQIAKHCTFSFEMRRYTGPDVICAFAPFAPLAWLEEWRPRIHDVDSSTSQDHLRAAFGVRYAELHNFARSLDLLKSIADGEQLAKALSRAVPHLDREARGQAIELILTRNIPRDHRLIAWAGFDLIWDALDLGEAFAILDRWLNHVPRNGLRENLLDLTGIAKCLQRVAGSEAMIVTASIVRRMASTPGGVVRPR